MTPAVYVDGVPLDEPYLAPDRDIRPFGPVAVPAGMLFVLGDDRLRSGDSRFAPPAGVGMVPEDDVIGEVVGLVWPPCRIGRARVSDLDRYEAHLRAQGFIRIAGADEAGRGALAGPLVAAAVILPDGFDRDGHPRLEAADRGAARGAVRTHRAGLRRTWSGASSRA